MFEFNRFICVFALEVISTIIFYVNDGDNYYIFYKCLLGGVVFMLFGVAAYKSRYIIKIITRVSVDLRRKCYV